MSHFSKNSDMKDGGVNWTLTDHKLINRTHIEKVFTQAKKEDPLDHLLLMVAANTGFRICEISHLKAEDVHEGGIVVIRRKKSKFKESFLPLVAEVLAPLKVRAKKIGTGWLWPGKSGPCRRKRSKKGVALGEEKLCDGGHISTREVQRRWKHYCTKAGVFMEKRGIHSLRHYAATEFYKETKDLRATQKFLDHSSSKITEIYADVVDMAEKIRKVKPVL